ncbi:MAG: ECF transporter S component [Oscillospiraceae bacterium]|nr:ECF transporter S component [Oscillospiraceae bacterium]
MLVIRSEKIRRVLRVALPFAIMPAMVLLLPRGLQAQHYALVTFLMTGFALLLFLAGFERRELGTRRMILVSVMTALSVLGRMLPVIKPITALTVLSALYLGPEAGFLTGALSAVLSNFIMGQGPWTPFQMLAWGMIGLFAGLLAKPLRRNRLLLYLYGMVSGFAYSMILDIWTTVWTYGEFTFRQYGAALVSSMPYPVVYALSNLIFLMLLAKPFGEKLARIGKKYGL